MTRSWSISLVVVLMAGGARADDAEDKAVKFVESLGGKVIRDDSQPGKPVVEVELFKAKLTDAGVKELAPFKDVKKLWLLGTQVTDKGLKDLAQFKNLVTLNLTNTGVTDEGMKELAQLKNLTYLYLVGTKVTDAGVAELKKQLPKCKINK